MIISIHTPVKGVTIFKWYATQQKLISIHTPVKGVTCNCWITQSCKGISIHTPVKGVTPAGTQRVLLRRYFNPHTREGCDLFNPRTGEQIAISIHTPVKGVTIESALSFDITRFQSTHP